MLCALVFWHEVVRRGEYVHQTVYLSEHMSFLKYVSFSCFLYAVVTLCLQGSKWAISTFPRATPFKVPGLPSVWLTSLRLL